MTDVDDRIETPESGEKQRRNRLSWLERSSTDRMISGLAGGVANRLQISSVYVRAAFVSLAFAGLVGAFLYAGGWLIAFNVRATDQPTHPPTRNQRIGLVMMFSGAIIGLRSIGLWFGDEISGVVLLAAFGTALIWSRHSGEGLSPRGRKLRYVGGIIVLLMGLAMLIDSVDSVAKVGPVILGASVAAAGIMLIFGPRISELAQEVSNERRERIASEARSEMAAHLHDSVLQTLAMIQRTPDPRSMVTLARSQERELRSWLYAGHKDQDHETLAEALEATADEVERSYHVPVEVVVVRDFPIDERLEPLLNASREAMLNSARHSGAPKISVYAELTATRVEVYVSDTGKGFDLQTIDDDRHGVRQSILGRMERHGGTADITSEAGEGTEVSLSLPWSPTQEEQV